MENIIPRWEWRTFGDQFGEAEARIKEYPAGKTRTSSEVYILSEVSNDNTKIRDLLMDVKTLQQVNLDRLEQWKPIMKGSFPLPAEEVRKVFGCFRVAPPELTSDAYSLEEFVQNLVAPISLLRAVDVNKLRTGYTIDNCIVEIADVTVNGKESRTIAVELEDPKQVIATVRKLGLDEFENINYLKGLKRIIGMKS